MVVGLVEFVTSIYTPHFVDIFSGWVKLGRLEHLIASKSKMPIRSPLRCLTLAVLRLLLLETDFNWVP